MKTVKVILSNPHNTGKQIDYEIEAYDQQLSVDWLHALKVDILQPKLRLDKEFCFLGFPKTHRNLKVLCDELNAHVHCINSFNHSEQWQKNGLEPYVIEEHFSPDTVRFSDNYPVAPLNSNHEYDSDARYLGLKIKHGILNQLHNHFERLQGTVWQPSAYYALASDAVKVAIRSLNLLCHEIESLVLSQRKLVQNPDWVRPSQITSFYNAPRRDLTAEHRQVFDSGYSRRFGEVYMHWCQIGKTLMEVFRDEGAPVLSVGSDPTDITVGSGATCEAINALKFYSGEFDIEWGKNVTYQDHSWHRDEIDQFFQWLKQNNIDSSDARLGLGHLPIATVRTQASFGTTDPAQVWDILSDHLNIYAIEYDGIVSKYEYSDNHA